MCLGQEHECSLSAGRSPIDGLWNSAAVSSACRAGSQLLFHEAMNSRIPRQALTQYCDDQCVISRTEGNMHTAGYDSAAIYFHVQTQSGITYRSRLMSVTATQLHPA